MIRVPNQFEISFDTNEIIIMHEDNTSTKTKVEPRIMQVLQILIKNSPNVVSRDQLISEVWDNYGGADDALNQTISHLRKLLNDTNKENRIIETVVKKGYRFTSEIEIVQIENKVTNRFHRKPRFWIALIAMALISFAILYFILNTRESFVPKVPQDTKSTTDSILRAPEG